MRAPPPLAVPLLAALLAGPVLLAGPALACGPDTDCEVEAGTYRIHLPPQMAGGAPTGAILFAHGYKGHAADAMGNAALTGMADGLGVALVSLESVGDDWTIPNTPSGPKPSDRDEIAYAVAVRDDVARRYAVDPARTIFAGFSAGGMLTWNVACEAGGDFAALVAFSGTFWEGPPGHCPTDATLWHFHGTSDPVVPIGGRQIGPVRQGDVESILDFYRVDKGMAPTAPVPVADLDCHRWAGPSASLEYCLHPGGHMFDPDWIRVVWQATFPDG